MCGIAGIIQRNPDKSLPLSTLAGMLQVLRHRGPDDEGILAMRNGSTCAVALQDTPMEVSSRLNLVQMNQAEGAFPVQLGHRRLSVIDLSPAGHQPMSDRTRRFHITYNGELYNYRELRESLQLQGIPFFTETDTEVVLQSYAAWGPQCVQRFDGMWSFLIYDSEKKILFASRDRFGVKPFYYRLSAEQFCFASEQKALLSISGQAPEINPQAVFDFLVLGKLELETEGLFKGIFELLPGHLLTLSPETWQADIRSYYPHSYNPQYIPATSELLRQSVLDTRRLVEDSITRRLRSDVPVGTCLSGGIDSSVIACTINSLLQKQLAGSVGPKQKLFTAVFPGTAADESDFAAAVAHHTLSEWHCVEPAAAGLLTDFERLQQAHDLPVFSSSSYAQFKVMELAASQGIKVLLDGQGADELFAGYKQYFFTYIHELKKKADHSIYKKELDAFIADPADARLLRRLSARLHLRKYLKTLGLHELKYVQPDLVRTYKDRMELLRSRFYSGLNAQLHADYTGNTLKELLRREDRNGMHFSLEARTPFADDPKLAEHIFALPGSVKIQAGSMKYLLREAFRDLLPQKIYARRDKKGFASPNNIWLESQQESFRQYLLPALSPYIKVEKLQHDFPRFMAVGGKPESFREMKFLSLGAWHKTFFPDAA